MRRLLALLLLLGAAAGGVLLVRQVEASARMTLRSEAGRLARGTRRAVEDAIAVQLEQMKARANAAAALGQVRTLSAVPDPATLRDSFQTEAWWQPYRDEFQAWQLLFGDPARDFTGGVEELRTGELRSGELAAEAAAKRGAAGIVQGPGAPFAAAVAPIDVPQRDGRLPLLLLARRIDAAMLASIAARAGGAVVLSDGRSSLAAAGPEEQQAALAALVGQEAAGPQVAADGSFAASPVELAPSVYLWSYTDAAPAVLRARAWEAPRRWLAIGGAALLGMVGLFLLLRRRATAPEASASFSGIPPTTPPGSAALAAPRTPTGSAPGLAPGTTPGAQTPAPAFDGTLVSAQPVTFGRYSVIEQIGQGGMADVYLAVAFGAENFRRTFVVKRLRPELARSPEAVGQFIDEARLGASLVHSNIIPVYDFGKIGNEYYLATEYILGRDAFRVVARNIERTGRPLDPPAVTYILQETLKALSYAHARTDENGQPLGLVHRDVSPSNILISARGEVKLFDFGIVKAEGRLTQTQAGIVKGNPSLMPPEQARGLEVDPRTDLFALSLTAYFLLAGAFLYQATSPYELLVKAAHGPGEPELAKLRVLPAPYDKVLEKALRVDPAGRYQDAAELAAALAGAPVASSAEMARLVEKLFAEDFRAEQRRFAAAMPAQVAVGE